MISFISLLSILIQIVCSQIVVLMSQELSETLVYFVRKTNIYINVTLKDTSLSQQILTICIEILLIYQRRIFN